MSLSTFRRSQKNEHASESVLPLFDLRNLSKSD